MRNIIILLSILYASCTSTPYKISKEDLKYLNGYWEISTVETSHQTQKQYPVNLQIDYYFISDSLSGFRKKVSPSLTGAYTTNNRKEKISIQEKEGHFYLVTNNEFGTINQQIVQLNQEQLILSSSSGTQYHYKRFSKLQIDE